MPWSRSATVRPDSLVGGRVQCPSLSDVGVGETELSRQVGNSPQGLAVTLLADYTLRTGTPLPSAAIAALVGEWCISPGSVRAAVSRLVRRGVLEGSRRGRRNAYRLTPQAALSLSAGGHCILSFPAQAEAWDGSWTLVAFSLPQEQSSQRRALRVQLRWSGYAPLYDGLWISPRDPGQQARAELADVNLGRLTVFRARQVELDSAIRRDPRDAWDVEDIARRYESFVHRWSPLLPRIRSGSVTGAEAVRARTHVMDTYRRFRFLDPQLPVRLMPDRWPRHRARDVFTAIYDGLAGAAEDHVRAVAARLGDGPQPGVKAHTTAELLAGVRHHRP